MKLFVYSTVGLVFALGCTSPAQRGVSSDGSEMLTRDGAVVSPTPLRQGLNIQACPPAKVGEECLLTNEADLDHEIMLAAGRFQGAQNPKPISPSQRDFHPKQHACLAALWRPLSSTPPALKVGAFAATTPRKAILRFSNGSPKSPSGNNAVAPDFSPDARGLGIKLVGVSGQAAIVTEDESSTQYNQDFVLINYPSFFLRTAKSYPAFFAAITAGQPFFSIMDAGEITVLKNTNHSVKDVMAERFFSQVPYKLGTDDVKYSVRNCDDSPAADVTDAEKQDASYLRKRIKQRLSKGSVCFIFSVQRRTGSMNVEDAVEIWPETQAPFVDVARIEIPGQQDIDDPARDAMCENISFNPWNSSVDNRPAGSINRARLGAYSAVSRKRRMENGMAIHEPTADDAFFSVLK